MTLSAQIKDAGRRLRNADVNLGDAAKSGDRTIFKAALKRWFNTNNYHNALLVSQIEQRKGAQCG